jgi:hypothetical protein
VAGLTLPLHGEGKTAEKIGENQRKDHRNYREIIEISGKIEKPAKKTQKSPKIALKSP